MLTTHTGLVVTKHIHLANYGDHEWEQISLQNDSGWSVVDEGTPSDQRAIEFFADAREARTFALTHRFTSDEAGPFTHTFSVILTPEHKTAATFDLNGSALNLIAVRPAVWYLPRTNLDGNDQPESVFLFMSTISHDPITISRFTVTPHNFATVASTREGDKYRLTLSPSQLAALPNDTVHFSILATPQDQSLPNVEIPVVIASTRQTNIE